LDKKYFVLVWLISKQMVNRTITLVQFGYFQTLNGSVWFSQTISAIWFDSVRFWWLTEPCPTLIQIVFLEELKLNYTFRPLSFLKLWFWSLKKQLFSGPLSILSVAILAPHANFDPVNSHVGATCVILFIYIF